MNILVLDDEIYLAQKVTSRLQEEGYHTTHHATISDIDYSIEYDTVLLSTNLLGNYNKIIKHYKDSIIILLVTYVSEATVTRPIEAGAHDYILKPFLMDELIRKIKHYKEFNHYKKENQRLQNALDTIFCDTDDSLKMPKELPILIESNNNKLVDKLVVDIALSKKKKIVAISLKNVLNYDFKSHKDKLLYLYDFHALKDISKKTVINNAKNMDIIIASNEVEQFNFPKLTMMSDNQISHLDSILTVNDYVKQITLNFQSKYTDTELSKRLGISRKSLWEKRKKFGIEKKKK